MFVPPNLSRIAVMVNVTTGGKGGRAQVNSVLCGRGFLLSGGLRRP
jgi:hypothetical protein